MTQDELKEISLVQLDIMDEVHRICQKRKITYYIIGGTLLGAVRHKGFIPWDVDIDLAMPREDYERFREICAEELGERFYYLDYTQRKNYLPPHALVCKRNTRICMKHDHQNPNPMERGIYLDVFPLDNAPDDPILQRKQATALRRLRRLKNYRLFYSYSNKRWKRYAHYGISALLSWISVTKLNRHQQKLMQKYREEQTQYLCSMASGYPYEKQCMPREIYGQPVLLEFEGREYCAPARYEDYLTRLYGDYMTLPPEEKRRANLTVFSSVEFG